MQKKLALIFLLGFSLQVFSQNFLMPSFPDYSTKLGVGFQHSFLNDTIPQNTASGAYDLYADIALNHILSIRVSVPFLINNPGATDDFNFGNIQLGISTKYWRHPNRGSVLIMEVGLPTGPKDRYAYYDYDEYNWHYTLASNWWNINSNDLHKYMPGISSTILLDYAYHLRSRRFCFNFHINPILIVRKKGGAIFQLNSSVLGGVNVKSLCFSVELLSTANLIDNEYNTYRTGGWSIVTGLQLTKTLVRPSVFYRANFKNTDIYYARHVLGLKLEIALAKKEKYLRNTKATTP